MSEKIAEHPALAYVTDDGSGIVLKTVSGKVETHFPLMTIQALRMAETLIRLTKGRIERSNLQ